MNNSQSNNTEGNTPGSYGLGDPVLFVGAACNYAAPSITSITFAFDKECGDFVPPVGNRVKFVFTGNDIYAPPPGNEVAFSIQEKCVTYIPPSITALNFELTCDDEEPLPDLVFVYPSNLTFDAITSYGIIDVDQDLPIVLDSNANFGDIIASGDITVIESYKVNGASVFDAISCAGQILFDQSIITVAGASSFDTIASAAPVHRGNRFVATNSIIGNILCSGTISWIPVDGFTVGGACFFNSITSAGSISAFGERTIGGIDTTDHVTSSGVVIAPVFVLSLEDATFEIESDGDIDSIITTVVEANCAFDDILCDGYAEWDKIPTVIPSNSTFDTIEASGYADLSQVGALVYYSNIRLDGVASEGVISSQYNEVFGTSEFDAIESIGTVETDERFLFEIAGNCPFDEVICDGLLSFETGANVYPAFLRMQIESSGSIIAASTFVHPAQCEFDEIISDGVGIVLAQVYASNAELSNGIRSVGAKVIYGRIPPPHLHQMFEISSVISDAIATTTPTAKYPVFIPNTKLGKRGQKLRSGTVYLNVHFSGDSHSFSKLSVYIYDSIGNKALDKVASYTGLEIQEHVFYDPRALLWEVPIPLHLVENKQYQFLVEFEYTQRDKIGTLSKKIQANYVDYNEHINISDSFITAGVTGGFGTFSDNYRELKQIAISGLTDSLRIGPSGPTTMSDFEVGTISGGIDDETTELVSIELPRQLDSTRLLNGTGLARITLRYVNLDVTQIGG